MQKIVSMEVGGRTLSLETGRIAKQASGAVLVRYGDSVVLVTAVGNPHEDLNKGFLPLYVEYRERAYAAGKIPGGFFKREGRPHEMETLSSRLIDRGSAWYARCVNESPSTTRSGFMRGLAPAS